MTVLHMMFWLTVSHFAFDYPLQGDTTAIQKSPLCKNDLSKHVPWMYWLAAHCLMQAGGVVLITGNLGLGMVELVIHALTDYSKCRGWIGIHTDQAIHICCKVLYVCFMVL